MSDPLPSSDTRLASLESALAELTRRVRVLEQGVAPPPDGFDAMMSVSAPAAVGDAERPDVVTGLGLIGRTFVIFAGAYLLRALTESQAVDRATGAFLGMLYAMAWTAVADRVAPRHALSATFFGACTVLIGFPLLWETTTRFDVLTSIESASALTTMTSVALIIAWRRELRAFAWLTTVSGCVLALVLLVAAGEPVPFAVFLIGLGIATLWLGYDREWTMLRWVAAGFADLAVLGLVFRALATPPRDAPSLVLVVQLLLVISYLGSIAIRTLVRGRDVIPFEIAQTAALLFAGLAGAVLIAQETGFGTWLLGPSLLILAGGCYAVEFIDRRRTRGANRYFYTSLALVFALTGSELVLDRAALGLLLAFFALVSAWSARQYGRDTLAAHSLIYVAAAAVAGGLAAAAVTGLAASPATAWPAVGATSATILFAMAAIAWMLRHDPARPDSAGSRALRLMLVFLLTAGAGGVVIVIAVATAFPAGASSAADHGIVATLRTAVLATAAVSLATVGARRSTREYGALLYPLLAWGAVKLVAEDFRTSPPLLLFIALALYGMALIIGPRMAKRGETDAAGAAAVALGGGWSRRLRGEW